MRKDANKALPGNFRSLMWDDPWRWVEGVPGYNEDVAALALAGRLDPHDATHCRGHVQIVGGRIGRVSAELR